MNFIKVSCLIAQAQCLTNRGDLHQIDTPENATFEPAQRACLHGVGGPQVGEVTPLGGVTRLSIQSLILI